MLRDSKGRLVKGHPPYGSFVKGHPNYLKNHTEDAKKRISVGVQKAYSEGRLRRKLVIPEEELRDLYWVKKLSTAQIGAKFGVVKETVNYWMKRYGIRCRTNSETSKGRPSWNKGLTKETDERLREAGRKGSITNTGRKLSEKHKVNISKAMTIRLENPEILRQHVLRTMRAAHVRPTKPEQRLIDIINKHELPFKYVGDGKVVIGGRCPDFINCNGGKQIIEVFGEYWHSPLLRRNMRASQGYEATVKAYAEYGFKTLILWETEMSNEPLVLRRINEFMCVV